MGIKYIHLNKCLEKEGIEIPQFRTCSMNSGAYKLMRVQMRAEFTYSCEGGPVVHSLEHDEKCRSVLEKARNEYVDLLLFPEYCISYKLLRNMVQEQDLWPEKNSLWCLPCQGIGRKDFYEFLEESKAQGIVVIADAVKEKMIEKNCYFVNAMFYCFISFDSEDEKKLVLVPQLKTHCMADPDYECEAGGMTLGSALYVIGGERDNCIVTLLCADSLNNEIQWEKLRNECGGKSLTILHPQLNTKPKHDTFSGIRHKIFEYCQDAIHITCNWAKGTRLIGDDSESEIRIELSWSCIYYKYKDKQKGENRIKQRKNFNKNGEHALYGAYMKKKQTAVWFTTSEEIIHEVYIRSVSTDDYAVTQPREDVLAEKHFTFSDHEALEEKRGQDFLCFRKYQNFPVNIKI